LFGLADIIVAVDVTFCSRSPKRRTPSPVASMFGAARVIQGTITAQKTQDILAHPKVEHFAVLDFFLLS
jgi:hypothetical protein